MKWTTAAGPAVAALVACDTVAVLDAQVVARPPHAPRPTVPGVAPTLAATDSTTRALPAERQTTSGTGAPRVTRRHRVVRRRAVTPRSAPSFAAVPVEAGGRVVTLRFVADGADGTREPVVTCAVLRACVIDLEPGEQLLGHAPIIGDAVRWRVGVAPSGPGGAAAIVWVKPTDCALATNLVLPTDRRVYHLALDSGPCGGSAVARGRYVSRVRFTYPDDSARASATARTAAIGTASATAVALGDDARTLAGIPVDALRLNFSYDLRRDRRFPWTPARVFDDGGHTFIQLPREADAYAAPALFELDDAGGKTLLNYVVRDGFYITDRTFRRAVLSVGQGKQEQRFEIENRAFGRASGSAARGAP